MRAYPVYLQRLCFGIIALTYSAMIMPETVLAADIVVPEAPSVETQPVASGFDDQRWRVIVSPYIWAASLNGNAGFLGVDTEVKVPFSDTFKNLDFSAMGNIEVSNGLYGAYLDGQYTKTSQKEGLHGIKLGVNIQSTTLAGGVFYRLYENVLEGDTVFGSPRVFAVEPTAGIRWTKMQADVDVRLGSLEEYRTASASWTDPFIGARVRADINDRWNLAAQADIGGFGVGSDLSANGQAYLGYRTFLFNQPAIIRVGYRALYQDYKTSSDPRAFRWRVTQHGPVAGLSLIF